MKCPQCGQGSKILSTRISVEGSKRRRHECPQGHRFTTRGSGDDLRVAPARNLTRETLSVRPERKSQEVAKPAWFALSSALFQGEMK